jgi:hypothetical protein
MAHTFLSQYHVLRIAREKQVVSLSKKTSKPIKAQGNQQKKEDFPFNIYSLRL